MTGIYTGFLREAPWHTRCFSYRLWKWVMWMRKRNRVAGWAVAGILVGFSCVRCGTQVCAVGFGDCDKMYANAPGSAGGVQTNNPLLLKTDNQTAIPGQQIQVTASGGKACNSQTPYQFSAKSSTDGSTANVNQVNLNGAYSFKVAGKYTVTAQDCGGQTNSIGITVTN